MYRPGRSRLQRSMKTVPAEKAGLLEGDILYQVDDHKIEDQDTSEVVSWIKGEEGTEVKLSVYRGEDREEHTLQL